MQFWARAARLLQCLGQHFILMVE